MAVSYRPLTTDPLRSFKFNVYIPLTIHSGAPDAIADPPGQGMARLGFLSVSGLGITIEPLAYREGGDNLTTRKMPGQADFGAVTLARGMFAGDSDSWLWMSNIFTALYGGGNNPVTGPITNDFRTNMYINVLEHPNTTSQATSGGAQYGVSYPYQNAIVKISFKLYSAWISTLAYSDLDAGGNAVAIEQMTLQYEGFDVKWAASGLYVDDPVVNW